MTVLTLLLALVLLAAAPPQPDPKYFHYTADVSITPVKQNYIVITPDIWRNATSDLRDLRLYSGATQVPYVLVPESSEQVRGTEQSATMLNLGRVNGAAQFLLDVGGGDVRPSHEWIRLTLRDDTPDFVTKAKVEGLNQIGGTAVDLGATTLFKLEKEKLGANLTLKFPPSVFRYLRVTVPDLDPKAITGAHVFSPGLANIGWIEMLIPASARTEPHDTIFEWDWPDTVPIGRVEFTTQSAKDFWRRVDLQGDHDEAIASGAIWSMQRRGNSENATNLELLVPNEARSKHFKLIVHNGDDPPLALSIKAAYRERRVYFTPTSGSALRLYFGDKDLDRPVYDYARTWTASPDAVPAQLSAIRSNPDYASRPDTRPWTEQHPAVLWIALGIAVLGLGAVALKSLKTTTKQQGTGA